MANAEATNGKPPRDLGFQDTGKLGAGVAGLKDGRELGKAGPICQNPGGTPLGAFSIWTGFHPPGTRGALLLSMLKIFKAVI